jgi:hypothetical protein
MPDLNSLVVGLADAVGDMDARLTVLEGENEKHEEIPGQLALF